MAGDILIFKIINDDIKKPTFIYTIKTRGGDLVAYDSSDLKLLEIPSNSDFKEVKGRLKVDEYEGLLYPVLYDKIPYILNVESEPVLAFWDSKNNRFIDSDNETVNDILPNESIIKIKIPTIFLSDNDYELDELEIKNMPYIPVKKEIKNPTPHNIVKTSLTPINIMNNKQITPVNQLNLNPNKHTTPIINNLQTIPIVQNTPIVPTIDIKQLEKVQMENKQMEEKVDKLFDKINELQERMGKVEEENKDLKNKNKFLEDKLRESKTNEDRLKEIEKETKSKLDLTYYSLETLIKKLYLFEVSVSPYPLLNGKYVLPAYGGLHEVIKYDEAKKYINPTISQFTHEVASYEVIPILQPFGGSHRRNNRMITIKLKDGKIYHFRGKYDNNTKQIGPPE